MKTSTNSDAPTRFYPGPALGLRFKQWVAMLVVALSLGGRGYAQLAVVNGDFTNLIGLTPYGGGWWAGTPNGWTAQTSNGGYTLEL